jgi:cytochrome c oxidase subunit 3
VLGGLVAWFAVTFKAFKGDATILQTESVGLLGAYWHYMLLVWGVLFAMLITT